MLVAVLLMGAVGVGIVFVIVRAAWERSRQDQHGGPGGHVG